VGASYKGGPRVADQASLPGGCFYMPSGKYLAYYNPKDGSGSAATSPICVKAGAKNEANTESNGGWGSVKPTQDDAITKANLDVLATCDVPQLMSAPSTDEALKIINRARPVIIRGGALRWAGRSLLTRDKFLAQTGRYPMHASRIPYADEYFGKGGVRDLTFQSFVEKHMGNKSYHHKQGSLETNDEGLYIFSNAVPEKVKEIIARQASPPKWLKPLMVREPTPQLFIGSRGSGAPVHYHTDAWNFLAYGRKRWRLEAPSDAGLGFQPAVDTFLTVPREPHSYECVQEAGDVLLVPDGWAHVTVNLADSVGLAYEMGYTGAMLGENR